MAFLAAVVVLPTVVVFLAAIILMTFLVLRHRRLTTQLNVEAKAQANLEEIPKINNNFFIPNRKRAKELGEDEML